MTLNSYFTLNSGWLFGVKYFACEHVFPAYVCVFAAGASSE